MAQQTLTTFDAALRNDYLPVVREQLENMTILLKRLKRAPMSGKQEVLVLRNGRNASVGAAAESAALAVADYQRYTQATISAKYTYGRIEVTGPTIASSQGSGAIVKALTSEVERLTDDMGHDMNRQLYGDGTGVITTVTTGASSATQTVGDTTYLYPGRVIYFGTSAAARTVSSVTSATVVVLTATISTTTGESVYHSGTQGGTAEMMGLRGIIDDGTYVSGTFQGLTRSSNTWFYANRIDNSGSGNVDLTLDILQSGMTAAEQDGGRPSIILCNHSIRDAYREIVVSDKRYVNTMDLDGGFKALEYNGLPIVADRQCQANTMYLLDERTMKLYVMKDVTFTPMQTVTGYDAIESYASFYGNLGADNCVYNCIIAEIQ